MIITCESCKTKFRLDSERLKGPRSKVRCTRCGHVFAVAPPPEEDLIEQIQPTEEPHLSALGLPRPPPAMTPTGLSVVPRKRGVGRLILSAALVVVVAWALWWALSHKDSLFSPVAHEPTKSQPQKPDQPTVSIIDSTQAFFLENAHSGQIFVVEGEVANESSKPISFVLLEGKLFTTDNRVAHSQRCFAGNKMTREQLSQLTMVEMQNLMMNREGKDLINVHVQPGQRIPFMMMFHNLPDLNVLSDYSIEVVSAESS
jgi:predicted Zn finger-like uncharacterized protein